MDGGSARCKDFVQHKILPNKRIQKVSCLLKVNEQCLSYPPSFTFPSVLPSASFSINTESLPKPKTVLISRIENHLVFGKSIARLTQPSQAATSSKLIPFYLVVYNYFAYLKIGIYFQCYLLLLRVSISTFLIILAKRN